MDRGAAGSARPLSPASHGNDPVRGARREAAAGTRQAPARAPANAHARSSRSRRSTAARNFREPGMGGRHPARPGGRLPPASPDRSRDHAGRQLFARGRRFAAGDRRYVRQVCNSVEACPCDSPTFNRSSVPKNREDGVGNVQWIAGSRLNELPGASVTVRQADVAAVFLSPSSRRSRTKNQPRESRAGNTRCVQGGFHEIERLPKLRSRQASMIAALIDTCDRTELHRSAPPSMRACAARSSARTCRAWSRWSPTASACSNRAPSAWPTSRPDARSPPTRCSDRLHDQADHIAGPDAARRAGPLRPRRSGRKISARIGRAESLRIVRREDRRISAPPSIESADRAAGPDPHVRPRLSVHQRDVARFQAARGETYPFGGPLLFDPGERWHYSTSTDVVGKLVEVVSGQKLEDYFRQHIFAPLKMNDTSYNVPQERGRASSRSTARRRADGRRDRAADAAARAHHPGADRRRRPCLDG